MNDSTRETDAANGASPEAQRFAARQREFQLALAADRLREIGANERKRREMEREVESLAPFYIGLFAVVFLVVAGWFMLDVMRCDSLFSTIPLAKRSSCPNPNVIEIGGGQTYHQPRLPQP